MNKRGFTLIELIVVIAIVGVLVLIATPKFLNYTAEAREARIKHNIKVAENEVEIYLIKNEALPDHWKYVEGNVLEQAKLEGRLYDREGLVTDEVEGAFNFFTISVYANEFEGRYKEIASDFIDSREKGKFYVIETSPKVFFIDNNIDGEESEEPNGTYGPNGEFIPEGYVLATDDDFDGSTDGNFRYKGNDEYVVIPHIIKGMPVTSYQRMFEGTYIKGVASNNTNINNMDTMFGLTKALELDLSNLDTSNTTKIGSMFWASQATKLNLSNFDTSNVTRMYGMFESSQAIEIIGLDKFDTSSVTDMKNMFRNSKVKELNLGGWDTSNVVNMDRMFEKSQFVKIDLSNFNTFKVNDMSFMFADSQVEELNLSSFDTSRVEKMLCMFLNSKVKTLDLSSFNTANVTDMGGMFSGSVATEGYSRTQEDADRFNASSSKPIDLTFIVK
ncbi:BspA family leucine-rich repeat surface protein [Tissierella sp. Yu-01]|uniref:BspA family leucine-rich repeat surface protein n=1 Tax=Tissierella sp. Yu-01 TaxID=3035694 RepID=UPI00240D43FA|nr:BspA family leucine-rich repeat surface protein [Tissierella sp. Yu-01]WFA09574.1 BspA family leucine-rich repeat surface protein [Tissierella sp. Yu-01]